MCHSACRHINASAPCRLLQRSHARAPSSTTSSPSLCPSSSCPMAPNGSCTAASHSARVSTFIRCAVFGSALGSRQRRCSAPIQHRSACFARRHPTAPLVASGHAQPRQEQELPRLSISHGPAGVYYSIGCIQRPSSSESTPAIGSSAPCLHLRPRYHKSSPPVFSSPV